MGSVARPTVCLSISTQRMDFWLKMAAMLNEHFDVVLLAAPAFKAIAEDRIPGRYKEFLVKDLYMSPEPPGDPDDVIQRALRLEKKYGFAMSLMISNLRDLGKGYIFNADCHPDMISSWWSHEHKLQEMVRRFEFWEHVCETYAPVMLIGESNSPPASAVAARRGIVELGLGFMKLGERHFWTENSHYHNRRFFERVSRYVRLYSEAGAEIPDVQYKEFTAAVYLDSKIDNGFGRAARDGIMRVFRETRHRLKRTVLAAIGRPLAKKPGYRYLGWLPVELRRPFSFRYMQKWGRTPTDLAKYRLVYVPMHLEPEIALMSVSPEFNNTMELVAWLSKSLPADHLIVLKENIVALGMRSLRYYDQLQRIGNVVFADLSVPSWEWIRRSEFTVTITGTAAIEAVYFLKPVLSLGKHQVVNLLPTVRYAHNFETTCQAVSELTELAKDDRLLRLSRAALNRAQVESSFDLSGAVTLYDGGRADVSLPARALESLKSEYPEVFPDQRTSMPPAA